MFGLDAVVDATGDLVLVEINPRVQTVTPLLSFVERRHGLLPAPGAHLLAFLTSEPPPVITVDADPGSLSQIVITAPRPGRVERALPPGRYVLGGSGRPVRTSTDVRDAPEGDEATVWDFAHPGDGVSPGDRLCVAILARPVAPFDRERSELGDFGAAWAATLSGSYLIAE